MANTVQIKRGSNTSVNAHTGPSGEIIYNLDTGRLHAQDGATAGGKPHALISDVDLKANAAITISAGTGLTGGGTLAANRTLALSSASIASLARADTAVQSVNGKSGPAVSIVKGDVGLGNVDNTSDLAKPVSTLTQAALNAKANSAITVSAGTGLTGGGNLTANRTVALNAASIASLGKADTALQAAGGSAGQILAKNSATTNDVVWVSSEAATAVSYGPQTLTEAQQGQARANIGAGILSGFRNKIINGDFDIWQRGEGPHTGFGYTADRWACYRGAFSEAASVSRQLFVLGHTEVPGNPAGYLRAAVTNGGPATNGYIRVAQNIEEVRTLAGNKATLTFYARANAPRDVAIELSQVFGSGGSPLSNILVGKAQLTTAWKKFSYVFDVPSLAGKVVGSNACIGLAFILSAGTDFSARTGGLAIQTGTFDFARVSIVEGDATAEEDPFSPRHIQQELALCQRYYEVSGGGSLIGISQGAGEVRLAGQWKVNKRVNPSMHLIASGSFGARRLSANTTTWTGQANITEATTNQEGVSNIHISGFTGLSSGEVVAMAGAYLAADAEL